MAGKVSPAALQLFLKELFGLTNSLDLGTTYLAIGLASSSPSLNSYKYYTGFTEPSTSDGYKREKVGYYSSTDTQFFNNITYNADGSVTITNSKEIKFDTYRGESALSVKYLVLATSESRGGGNNLLYFELETPITLNKNELLVIPVGQASCTIK